jgi:hypothetical protein
LVSHPGHKVAIKSTHGTYLQAHEDGKVDFSNAVNEHSLWTWLPLEGEHMAAFFSHFGNYLRA